MRYIIYIYETRVFLIYENILIYKKKGKKGVFF